VHLERGGCRCSIYAQRPVPCRAYDCRNDKRIWADFERRIPSPELERLFGGDSEAT
jgi:Fe-S-cluster containining protein